MSGHHNDSKARQASAAEPPESAARRLDVLQAGLDRVNEGFTIIDRDLRLVAWNRTFFDMLDFPPGLARFGTPFEAFMRYNAERGEYGPGDIEQMVAQRVRRASDFEAHYFERVRPDGRIIAVRGEPVPGCGFVTIYTDVTAQRAHERLIGSHRDELERRVSERTAALARSEERLRLVTDSIPALIAYFDEQRIYRFANRGYAEWFGYGKPDLVGRPIAEVLGDRLHAELAPHVECAMAGHTVSYEYATVGKDGRTRHAASTLVPEIDAGGRVSGVFVLSSDITEQKQAEAALLHARKMEAVGQLAGGLSHDFNNMLTVVIGNLMALQDRFAGTPGFDELADPALLATQRGVELIRRLLTFARQQPLAPQPVAVAPLVDNLVRLLRRSLPETIELATPVGGQPLHVLADPHQIENALLNLAFNARDAMAEGGGRLAVNVELQALHERAAAGLEIPPGAYVCISVRDTGCGMSPATAARACEPFFTTKPFGSGSGLGLSMVYGFVKQSGGGMRISSAVGDGTRVDLFLPCGEPPPTADEAPPPRLPAAADKAVVLLVEDDPEVRPVVRRQLTELGFPVIEARDGVEAGRMLANVPDIGIMVSDIVMPGGIDGHALAAEARRRHPRLRVMLISGYSEAAVRGDIPLLCKPFSKQQLAAALEALSR